MAGIDLGDAWADEVWEAGVWADGVWAGQEDAAGDTPGQAGDLSAASRATKQHGVLASMILRGVRTILFFLIGAQ